MRVAATLLVVSLVATVAQAMSGEHVELRMVSH